jgi:hypothetical protein
LATHDSSQPLLPPLPLLSLLGSSRQLATAPPSTPILATSWQLSAAHDIASPLLTPAIFLSLDTTHDNPTLSPHLCHFLVASLCYCKHTSSELEKCWRARQYDTPQGDAVHAPHSTDLTNPLSELTTRNSETRRDHLSLNAAPNKKFPHISTLTGTQHPTRTLYTKKPSNEIRPRYGGEPNTWPHPPTDRRHTPPLPMTYTEKQREQSEAK